MPGKSQQYSDAVLNVLRGAGVTGVAPYLGLFSVAPGDDASPGTELSGNDYERQGITFGAPASDTYAIDVGPEFTNSTIAIPPKYRTTLIAPWRCPIRNMLAASMPSASARIIRITPP
jgi:hypothetical protein